MELISEYFRILSISLIRYFLLAGLPFFLIYKLFFTHLSRAKIQEKVAQNRDFYREVFYSIQASAMIAVVAIIFTKTPLRQYSLIYTDLADYSFWWLPLSVVIALIMHDTYFYWMHRTLHHSKLYRHMHRVHHQSTNPSPWASYSFHFTEAFAEALILPIIIFIIPIHPVGIIIFAFSSFFINVYGHLGYEVAPQWLRRSWLFEVLNTSVHHNLHHSTVKGNYGLYFRLWDRLMNTENPDYVKRYDEVQANRKKESLKSKV